MAIDYIKRNDINDDKINMQLDEIKNEILKTNTFQSNWLLLYESAINKWFGNDLDHIISGNKFFELMKKCKIEFYNKNEFEYKRN